MPPWEVVEHTADVGLRATGESLEEALAELVVGFAHLLCPEGEVASVERRVERVEAGTLDRLVVDILDDLNYVHQVEGFLPAACTVTLEEAGPEDLTATLELAGERYDPDLHGHLMEIKATTFHRLRVERDPAVIEVIFDI